MDKTYRITLDVGSKEPQQTNIVVCQGDSGIKFEIEVTGIDTTGILAKIVFRNQKNESYETEEITKTGIKYIYTLLGNEISYPGTVVADVKLIETTKRISSTKFLFTVDQDTLNDTPIQSGAYSSSLDDAIDRALAAAESAENVQDGISPTITANSANNSSTYKLDIATVDGTFTTPNLKGQDGNGAGDMTKAVYDTQNKAMDIFEYVDGQVDQLNSDLTEAINEIDNNTLSIITNVKYPPAPMIGAKGDGTTNDTSAIQNIINASQYVFFPAGVYRLTATLQLNERQHIFGVGESSTIYGDFTGGAIIEYQHGEPVFIQKFRIDRNISINVVDGDDGIKIGFGTTAWAGRGYISDLLIANQYTGFRWKAGTSNAFSRIQCIGNKGDGFLGVNPRGEFSQCLSQYNQGNGFNFYTSNSGETGVVLNNCSTFCNQGFGILLDTDVAIQGANLFLNSYGSSFDGRGGIYCEKQYIQIYGSNIFIEYSGFSSNFQPTYTAYNDANGLQLGSSVSMVSLSNVQVLHCKGSGVYLNGCDDVAINTIYIYDCGKGMTGNSPYGLAIANACHRLTISNYTAGAPTSGQTIDLNILSASSNGLISNAVINSESVIAQTGIVGKNIVSYGSNTVASAGVVTLPFSHDFIEITGTTNINAISASWKGRKVTLKFADTLSIYSANNMKLNSTFTSSADDMLTLLYDGVNWREVSRIVL